MIVYGWRVVRGDRRIAEGIAPNRWWVERLGEWVRRIMEGKPGSIFMAPFVGEWRTETYEIGDIKA